MVFTFKSMQQTVKVGFQICLLFEVDVEYPWSYRYKSSDCIIRYDTLNT